MADSMAQTTEAEVAARLARGICKGDTVAESELFDRYSAGLLFLLRRLTGDPSLAEDLHQETFRIVIEKLRASGLENPEGLASYLRGTARNLFLGEYRKRSRRRTDADEEAIDRAVDPEPNQLRRILDSEENQLVHHVIDELKSDRDRQVLYRFYIAEDDKEQICADLDLGSLHFNRVLFRARQRFKEQLQRLQKQRLPGPPEALQRGAAR